MKKFNLLWVLLFASWPLVGRADQKPNVDVRVGTPAGQIEVTNQPPPPVIVVQPPPRPVVVEKQVPPPPPPPQPPPQTGGCHCSLMPTGSQAWGFLSLATGLFLGIPRWKKRTKGGHTEENEK